MTNCTSSSLEFPACRKRRVAADFSGGDTTSNGGVLLLRQADRLSGLTASVARRLIDARQRGKVGHRFVAMLRQRVFGLALGYEDVNDHAALRHDLALQTAAERDCALASPSTLSRFENAASRDWAWNIHEGIVKLTECRLLSAFLHGAKPLKLHKAAIDNLPRFRSESG